MSAAPGDKFAAGEQGLGYIYQPRFALLQLFKLPEATSVLIEKDDDLDFIDARGVKSLGSLKHKAEGERITDLSVDFWKSVRIWLSRYERDGRVAADLRFFLFTTATVATSSFLHRLLHNAIPKGDEEKSVPQLARDALKTTNSTLVKSISLEYLKLNESEQEDFLSRIVIFDAGPRIQELPELIKDRMRSVRREHRDAVFERLEGWWNEAIIELLVGKRITALTGFEVFDKLAALSEEYQTNNLPINFRHQEPAAHIGADTDHRLFVRQLREIGVSSARIRNAILDYYRAFEQRSSWTRENLLVSGELDNYEDRLIDEWSRYRDVVFEELDETTAEDVLLKAGRDLYRWADLESGNITSLRIREKVTEPYVTRGGFHILANFGPLPKVWWHPRFIERLTAALGVKK